MASHNPLPYEFTLRRPGVEITVRTENVNQLSNTHSRAHHLLEALGVAEETPYLRYHLPSFLVRDKAVLKRMARYEKKYPDLTTIDFSIPLIPHVCIDESEAGVSFTLSDEQIIKARTRVAATMPKHARELWIITHGNLTEAEARRFVEPLSLTERIGFEHHETDLDDILRIVIFCFTPTEANPCE
jgi:hypothetical protein